MKLIEMETMNGQIPDQINDPLNGSGLHPSLLTETVA